MHTKFRDEPRPKSGLLRVREFTMKDAYTLDIDRAGLDAGFEKHRGAYQRIFSRIGLDAVGVEASSGAMGGKESVEFMVRSEAGEDWIVTCSSCDYRANVQRATSALAEVDDGERSAQDRFPTPGLRTIKALAEAHPDTAAPDRQIKTLVYLLDGEQVLVLLRGDHNLQEQKLLDATAAVEARAAGLEEIRALLGADPGSLGAVGVGGLKIVADEALRGRFNLVTGANEDDWHHSGVDIERDIAVSQWADLREVTSGEPCPVDGGTLELWKGIEVGHIFKLGTQYSETFGAYVQDEKGDSHPIIMGSYGIGVERGMAAVVEASHDENGIIWPVSVAPYEVVITVVRADDAGTIEAADRTESGIEALLDDREERPGVKFADAELIGIPYRVTVGPRGVADGVVEMTTRRGLTTEEVGLGEAAGLLSERISEQRFGI
jgi:prolyl-tRNA synthetase